MCRVLALREIRESEIAYFTPGVGPPGPRRPHTAIAGEIRATRVERVEAVVAASPNFLSRHASSEPRGRYGVQMRSARDDELKLQPRRAHAA
jgi:hypothetical protein